MSDKRILIIGGGFAGLHAAVGATETLRAAGEHEVSVELVGPDPDLVIRPRLYETDLSGVRVPLDPVLAPLGVKHRRANVLEIDIARRMVHLSGEAGSLSYDQLVLAAGSSLQMPAGCQVHAADSYSQAIALSRAGEELARQPDARYGAVVVGAGFTGLEIAAELAGVLRRSARAAGRRSSGRVTLVERSRHIAPGFGPRARRVIEEAVSSLGVEMRAGVGVSDVRRDGVALADGSRVDAELVVWAAGPRASALTEQIPGSRDAMGRLHVDRFLATGVEGIWAAGDCAAASVDGRHIAVMSCQHAMPQGRRAGENAAAVLLDKAPSRYRQPLYLTCLDLGDHGALLTCGFERNSVLATGQSAKQFKRYINRSLIYPPTSSDPAQLLTVGHPAPAGPVGAALSRLALRSAAVRDRVTEGAEDRASRFAGQPDPASAPLAA